MYILEVWTVKKSPKIANIASRDYVALSRFIFLRAKYDLFHLQQPSPRSYSASDTLALHQHVALVNAPTAAPTCTRAAPRRTR